MSITIRPARNGDAPALAEIYNHYVLNTTISFEESPVTPDEMAGRIEKTLAAGLPWLVLLEDERIAGYAYASKWRERAAYRYAVETSIYLRQGESGKGHGRALYDQLIALLRECGIHTVIGGIAQPNEASVRLHEKLGFEQVAMFRQVGRKFDRRIDVGYWQLHIGG
jgi:L-amino acid N-acyltransferase YncA